MKTMKTELSLNDLELVTGSGAVHQRAKKKFAKKIIDWLTDLFS